MYAYGKNCKRKSTYSSFLEPSTDIRNEDDTVKGLLNVSDHHTVVAICHGHFIEYAYKKMLAYS